MKLVDKDALNVAQKRALKRAIEAMKNSYNPYSNLPVGACLYRQRGRYTTFVTGTNCENASYGLTICAERTAFVKANSLGERDFDGIVVVASSDELSGPCGACRQFIQEFSDLSTKNEFMIIMVSTKLDKVKIATTEEILPESFGPSSLGVDLNKYK